MANTVTIEVNGSNNTGPMFVNLNQTINNFNNNVNRASGGFIRTLFNLFRRLPPQLQVAVATAGAAIGTTFATAIGASANAALLGAIGGGVLVGGIAAAVKDSTEVQEAFSGLFEEVKNDVLDFSQVFVGPLVDAAQTFRTAWNNALSTSVYVAFRDLASVVEPLSEGLTDMVQNAMPGFNKAVQASRPILEKLAQLLPDIGDALDDFFDSIADGKDGAVKGLVFMAALLVTGLNALGETVEFLSKAFDYLTEKSEKLNKALSNIPVVGPVFAYVAEAVGNLNDKASKTSGFVNEMGSSMSSASDATTRAAEAAKAFEESLDELFSTMTNQTDAALAYEEAIDELSKSVEENGRQIDIGTEKGRNNVQAIEAIARAAWQMREAEIAAGGGVDQANGKFQSQINALGAMLEKMGFTKAQIHALLLKWQELAQQPDINKRVTTTVTTIFREEGSPNHNRTPGRQVAFAHGGIVGAATGGARSRLTLVGEQGPELVDFSQGRVYNNGQSKRMLAEGGGGGGTAVLIQPGSNPDSLWSALIKGLRIEIINNFGGDVTKALGRA